MGYIVFDKETGIDITDKVVVSSTEKRSFNECRLMADKTLEKAEKFYENEIVPKMNERSNLKMEDFGPEFDPNRGELWSKRMNELRDEIDILQKEYASIMEIAGDWEDKEYAARLLPVIEAVSNDSDNPLREKMFKIHAFKSYFSEMGVPTLGKYL